MLARWLPGGSLVSLFSVIIPTYSRPVFLQEAIDSVLAQTTSDYEIIVVDDASPEPVVVPEHSRIRVVRAEVNGGSARARNIGVEAATGDVVAFLDDDDTWTPQRLSFALAALERAPVAVCWQSATGGRMLDGNVHDTILDSITPNFGATAVLRSAWVPIDESFRSCQDLTWWLSISRHNSVATHPEQGLEIRRHAAPRVGYGTEQRIRDSLRLMDEQAGYFRSHPYAASFRWKRIGLMNLALGRPEEARKAFRRAFRLHPTAVDAWHYLRSFRG